jgi:hypothetical protein
VAAAVGLASASGLLAASLDLSNLVLNNHDGKIQVRFGLSIPDLAPLYAALAEGGVLALHLEATLSRKVEYLWDRQVAEAGRMAVVRKKGDEYLVEPSPSPRGGPPSEAPAGSGSPLACGPVLAEVLRRAFGEIAMDLGSWDLLERGEAYVLVLTIGLGRADVSAFMRNALFFWSFDVIPKTRYRLDFTY